MSDMHIDRKLKRGNKCATGIIARLASAIEEAVCLYGGESGIGCQLCRRMQ